MSNANLLPLNASREACSEVQKQAIGARHSHFLTFRGCSNTALETQQTTNAPRILLILLVTATWKVASGSKNEQSIDSGSGRVDFALCRIDLGLGRIDFVLGRIDFGLGRIDFGLGRIDFISGCIAFISGCIDFISGGFAIRRWSRGVYTHSHPP